MSSTLITRDFRLRIHAKGTTAPVDGTVDFTLTDFVELPRFAGQVVLPTKGQTQASPATYQVLDTNGVLTAELGDSDGLPHLLGRLAELQERDDGGSWETTNIGRLTNLRDVEDGAAWLVTVADERWKERNSKPWGGADTTQVWPAGIRGFWRGSLQRARVARGESVNTSGADLTRVRLSASWPLERIAVEWIEEDLVDEPDASRTDAGNFEHLRLNLDGTDYEVVTFGELDAEDLVGPLESAAAWAVYAWVRAVGGLPAPAGDDYVAYLWAPTAPPSKVLPLHLGVLDASHRFGYSHPFRQLRELYDEAGVRYDLAAFQALEASYFYGSTGDRITDPDQDLASFAEDRFYKRFGVIPFLNDQGELAPKPVRLPDEDASGDHYVDPTTAFEFNSGNTITRPTWDQSAREVVNVFQARRARYRLPRVKAGAADAQVGSPARREELESLDGRFLEETLTDPVEHGSVADLGPHPEVYDLTGIPSRAESWLDLSAADERPAVVELLEEHLRRDVFGRFGVGPIWVELLAQRKTQDGSGRTPEDDVWGGDLVRLDFDTLPDANTSTRGGTVRLAQVMERIPQAQGILFRCLDIGPAVAAGSVPTIVLAAATDVYNAVEITISGLDAGQEAEIDLQYGAGGDFGQRKIRGLGNGTVEVGEIPSGTQITGRARAMEDGKVKSDWSSSSSHTTTTLPAPTIDSVTVNGLLLTIEITPGTGVEEYPWVPLFRQTGGGSWEDALEDPIGSDDRNHTFFGDATSTSYDVGAQHVDPYGGRGAIGSDSASTDGSETQLAAPRRVQILQGRGANQDLKRPEEAVVVGRGFELAWFPQEPHARTLVQVSTDSGFATIERAFELAPGVTRVKIDAIPLDSTTRYLRMKHVLESYTDSSWSETVSALPTYLVAGQVRSDAFPGGYARLVKSENGNLAVVIDHGGDPDVDGAYYEWEENPADPTVYPDVDTGDTFVDRVDMPFEEEVTGPVAIEVGDVFTLTVRFWNAVSGFGQSVTHKLEVETDREARIMAASWDYDNDGDPDFYVHGNERTTTIYGNVGVDSTPSDPNGVGDDFTIAAQRGSAKLNLNVRVGERVHLKVVGENAAGELGPVEEFSERRTGMLRSVPRTEFDVFRSGTTASISLRVDDPWLAVTDVEYRRRENDGSDTGWVNWSEDTGTPGTDYELEYSINVDVDPGKDSQFLYRITFTDEQDNAQVLEIAPVHLANTEDGSGFTEVGFGSFKELDGSSSGVVIEAGASWDYIRSAVAAGVLEAYANVQIPKDAELTAFKATLYQEDSGSEARAQLYETGSGGSTLLYDNPHPGGGALGSWSTVTATSAFTGTSEAYLVKIKLDPDGGAAADARFAKARLEYDRPTLENVL